ncbi:MAG TPA: HlyD family secretion protein [Steroidobacteraceae bacterium]|nr:HlyD family secretion protein [Steroidobacteraceae bacterium]
MAEDEHDSSAAESSGNDRKERAHGFLRRPVVRVLIVVIAVLAVAAVIAFGVHAHRFESTDDAFVDARIVRLAPQIAGRVVHVYVTDNELVRTGERLVDIDEGDVRARLDEALAQEALARIELDQAQTQVNSSKAAYAQATSLVTAAQAQAENAQSDLRRYIGLQKTNPLAVAQAQLDQAAATARSATAQYKAAKQQARSANAAVAAAQAQAAGAAARIKVLEAQVEQARLSYGYARVVAPVDGHIAQRRVAIGSYVTPGQQMLAIVPLQMWVTANFKETQLADMRPGQHVSIDIDACPGAEANGHVDSIQRGAGQAFALLPPENATGNYVKVVQRVPVKIVFDRVPRDCPLGPGLSVTPNIRVH